ncbi:MAG: hypothetical protein KatS3mg084_0192 [Candidatus Dojkabacteria bacterium]|nr:MAG: hypothetical protein KatS3mg084_0192 [Candidatus Dojkabacteria bacterium]
MKFFTALAVYFLCINIYFWSLVFLFGVPRIYSTELILNNSAEYALSLGVNREEAAQAYIKGEKYIFSQDIKTKHQSIMLLTVISSFISIISIIIMFYKKSYLTFPMITAIVSAVCMYTILWLFPNTLPQSIYLDIADIVNNNPGILALRHIGVYIVLLVIIIIFTNWYRLHER